MDKISFIINDAAYLTMLFVVVIMIPLLVVGLFVGVFQAATQIQEMTLSFIPKLIVLIIIVILGGAFLGNSWQTFCHRIFQVISTL